MTLPGGSNPADVLFKLAKGRGLANPTFEQVHEGGPPHAKTFTWVCNWLQGKYFAEGCGRSKKEAKNASAKKLIEQLDLSTLPDAKPQRDTAEEKAEKADMMMKKAKKRIRQVVANPGNLFWGPNSKAPKMNPAPAPAIAQGEEGESPPKKSLMGEGWEYMGDIQEGFDPWRSPFPVKGGRGRGRGFGRGRGAGPHGTFTGPMRLPHRAPMMMMGPGPGCFPEPTPPFSEEDHHVVEKHQSIFPEKEELQIIMEMVHLTEKALKTVSDTLVTALHGGQREMVGVARVGDLAKGLLLAGDRQVELVVMCRQKPTVDLLDTIAGALDPLMSQVSARTGYSYQATAMHKEAALAVTLEEGAPPHYRVLVSLTSTQHRVPGQQSNQEGEEEVDEDSGDEEAANDQVEGKELVKFKEGDEGDKFLASILKQGAKSKLLPRKKCLKALAELRHSKWFSAMATPMDSCVEAIRVFRHLARRNAAFGKLGSWPVELVVERSLASSTMPLSPSNALLRVFEAISSGLLQEDGPGIKDPCEREQEDVLAHLTTQEREDITHFAMDAVRKIHYGKIHEVLDMSKLSQDELKQKENQVPEEEYFAEGDGQSHFFDVNDGNGVTEEDAAAREEKLAQEKEEGLKAEKEKREEAMKRIEAKEAERKKEEEGK